MTNPTLINIESKRKPSRALIMRIIGEYIARGHKDLDIRWGENWIEIVKGGNQWFGAGWIKDISGDDLAQELTGMESFVNNHFSFVTIK